MFGSRNFLFAQNAVDLGTALWSWGNNSYGQLGRGNTTNYSSPVQVGPLVDWLYPSAGGITNHSVLCTKTDNTLWAWGNGSSGVLGTGNTTSRSSPVQVGALTNWKKPVVTGTYGSLCIKTDGTMWSWGAPTQGQLGLGNFTSYSSPKQIGSDTNWSKLGQSIYSNMLAVKTTGTLWAWGSNYYGQLGFGNTTGGYNSPKQVGALTDWASPATGNGFSLCVKTNGTLWTWGKNSSGQLGLGDTISRSSPTQVGALTNWAKPSAGVNSSACVKTDGTAWMWGSGSSGVLGLGNGTNYSSPKQIGSLTDWAYVRASWGPTLGIKTNKTLWTWGPNSYGQLGLGDTTNRSSPVQVGTSTSWINQTAARTTSLCTKDGPGSAPTNLTLPIVSGNPTEGQTLSSTLGTWSNDPYSFTYQWQRGTSNIGGATSSTYVVQAADVGSTLRCVITATNSKGATVANSANTITVVAASVRLYAWGRNNQRQLGQGASTTDQSSPVQVGSSGAWTQVSGGGYHVAGLVGGALATWGSNSAGQIGDGTSGGSRAYPAFSRANTAFVNAGRFSTFIITTTGQLWSWGSGTYGGLGLGNTTYYSSPKQVGSLTNWAKIDALGSFGAMAIKTDGTLWTWGSGANGRLGLGNTTNYSSPKQVGADTDWASIPSYGGRGRWAAAAIKTNGTLWTWGNGSYGNLGHGNTTSYSSPKQVGAGTTWAKIANNYSGFSSVKTDGTLWAWGRNQNGQLGLGDTTNRSSPVQVGALTNWSIPVGGYYFTGCIKTDGTMWSWGRNDYGQLGLGNTTNYSSPKQIGSLTNWTVGGTTDKSMMGLLAVATAAPTNYELPVVTGIAKVGYTLSCSTGQWTSFPSSFSYQWQQGTSNIGGATSSTYTIVSGDIGFTIRCVVTATNAIGSTAATTASTGTVVSATADMWAWGSNSGNLGLGNNTSYSSPVQFSSSGWANPAGGRNGGLSTKSDGTLWTWGNGSYGQNGTGNTTSYSNPRQIGTLTNWSKPARAGGSSYNGGSVFCVKTDNTLWAWGKNTPHGQLGLNDTTNRSSPVQIGALTNWAHVTAGPSAGIAVKTSGQLWGWGYGRSVANANGFSSPVQIGSLTNWSQTGGSQLFADHSMHVKTDNTLWVMGNNSYGQLGNGLGPSGYAASPIQIGGAVWASPLVGGCVKYFSACVRTDGTLWTWGRNNYGQLGLGDTSNRSSPVQVGSLTSWSKVVGGARSMGALKTDGTLWAWGINSSGQLGLGDTTNRSSPVQIGAQTNWVVPAFGYNNSWGRTT